MLKFLENITLQAGKILLDYQCKKNSVSIKADKSFVGEADLASESFLIENIMKEFPDSKIISEEKDQELGNRTAELTWIIDPLDGTTNYLHKFPYFAVSIGVYQKDQALAGCVYNPASKTFYLAEKGKGAFCNKERLKVSEVNDFYQSLFITGFYYFQGEMLKKQIERFYRVQEVTRAVRRTGAAALDICAVASGIADGFWEEGLKVWDAAGGAIVLKESGGIFTDFSGKPGNIFGSEFVFTNGLVHDQLLKIIQTTTN